MLTAVTDHSKPAGCRKKMGELCAKRPPLDMVVRKATWIGLNRQRLQDVLGQVDSTVKDLLELFPAPTATKLTRLAGVDAEGLEDFMDEVISMMEQLAIDRDDGDDQLLAALKSQARSIQERPGLTVNHHGIIKGFAMHGGEYTGNTFNAGGKEA